MGIKLSDYIKDIETLFTEEEIIDIFERAKRDKNNRMTKEELINDIKESIRLSEHSIGDMPEWDDYWDSHRRFEEGRIDALLDILCKVERTDF